MLSANYQPPAGKTGDDNSPQGTLRRAISRTASLLKPSPSREVLGFLIARNMIFWTSAGLFRFASHLPRRIARVSSTRQRRASESCRRPPDPEGAPPPRPRARSLTADGTARFPPSHTPHLPPRGAERAKILIRKIWHGVGFRRETGLHGCLEGGAHLG